MAIEPENLDAKHFYTKKIYNDVRLKIWYLFTQQISVLLCLQHLRYLGLSNQLRMKYPTSLIF